MYPQGVSLSYTFTTFQCTNQATVNIHREPSRMHAALNTSQEVVWEVISKQHVCDEIHSSELEALIRSILEAIRRSSNIITLI